MEPRAYISAYLERAYFERHADLTPAARELARAQIQQHPEKYAATEHAQALVVYLQTHERLMRELAHMEELPDEEFEQRRSQLFGEMRLAMAKIGESDRLCIDAQLVSILLADVGIDDCLSDLLTLETRTREYLERSVEGFDADAPRFWSAQALSRVGDTAASLTLTEPVLIGWLHTLEAISQLCLASARYRAGISYAQRVLKADGYPSRAEGTVFLCLARLEDEDGFFSFARTLEQHAANPAEAARLVEDSPWYLLGRALLLYKLGRRKPARRAVRDFAARCDGGAFFLLNPTYLTPYLPVRPPVREPWELTHQAVWEADGIIADVPDFAPWAEAIEGMRAASEAFADRNGF